MERSKLGDLLPDVPNPDLKLWYIACVQVPSSASFQRNLHCKGVLSLHDSSFYTGIGATDRPDLHVWSQLNAAIRYPSLLLGVCDLSFLDGEPTRLPLLTKVLAPFQQPAFQGALWLVQSARLWLHASGRARVHTVPGSGRVVPGMLAWIQCKVPSILAWCGYIAALALIQRDTVAALGLISLWMGLVVIRLQWAIFHGESKGRRESLRRAAHVLSLTMVRSIVGVLGLLDMQLVTPASTSSRMLGRSVAGKCGAATTMAT